MSIVDNSTKETVQWCKDCGCLGVLDEVQLRVEWIRPEVLNRMRDQGMMLRTMAGAAPTDEDAALLRQRAEDLEQYFGTRNG
jgi:hypothetical protein